MVRVLKAEKTSTGDWTSETFEVDPERGVAYPPALSPEDIRHPVTYAGRIFPNQVQTTWTRGDDLQVVIEVRTTSEDGPVPLAFSVTSKDGLQGIEDYRPPVPTMAVRAAKGYGFLASITLHKGKPLIGDEARMERLEVVTDAYLEATELNKPKAAHIAKALDDRAMSVSKSRIYHLIQEAKDEGLLPRKKSK